MPDFDPRRILFCLLDHGVDFVVIGASAAIFHGVPLEPTLDMDVAAATRKTNLRRLAAALEELEAELRLPDPEESVPLKVDERMLKNVSVLTLSTRYGPFDVLFEPSGAPPYDELRERSIEVKAYGAVFRAAGIDDIVAMKQAAGREKDAAHLTALMEFVQEQRRRGS